MNLIMVVHIINAAVKRDGDYTGIPSGFRDLDQKLGGLNRSDLIILAARPAMGKTALVTNMAFNAAQKANGKVAFFSLEMASEQLATRMLSEQSGVSSENIRKGEINSEIAPFLEDFSHLFGKFLEANFFCLQT